MTITDLDSWLHLLLKLENIFLKFSQRIYLLLIKKFPKYFEIKAKMINFFLKFCILKEKVFYFHFTGFWVLGIVRNKNYWRKKIRVLTFHVLALLKGSWIYLSSEIRTLVFSNFYTLIKLLSCYLDPHAYVNVSRHLESRKGGNFS